MWFDGKRNCISAHFALRGAVVALNIGCDCQAELVLLLQRSDPSFGPMRRKPCATHAGRISQEQVGERERWGRGRERERERER
eukprot:SAG31_NODE_23593_length_501_cov_0.636816_1_plen_82_part_10